MRKIGKLVSLLILPLIGMIVYSALRSYFFKDPPIWSFEMALFFFGSFFMLGAAYCHLEKKHVAVDVITHYLPPKWNKIQGIFSEGVVLSVALVIIYISIPNAWRSTLMMERSPMQTPFNPYVWWFRWIIPISAALLAWQAVKNMLSHLFNKPGTTESLP